MLCKVWILLLVWQWFLASCTNGFCPALVASRQRGGRYVEYGDKQLPGKRYNLISPAYGSQGSIQSALGAFLWFGGNEAEENNDGEPDEIASASLRGVSNIMESVSGFKSSQRVGERAGAILQELSNTIVDGTAVDGKVKVSYNGQQMPVGVQIDEAYLQSIKSRKEGTRELEVAMMKAMQDGHTKSGLKLEEKLKSLYTDLGFES